LIALCAVLPAGALLYYAFWTSRNIAYWDEIDTVLGLLLRLQSGVTAEEFLVQLSAVANEHRTVTSRLLFALSYALTGTVNFVWIGVMGNAFIVAACALLVFAVRGAMSRLRLAAVLGFMVFHLGNYETFLWSGASIDHFQVVALAIASLIGLARGSRAGLLLAGLSGVAATFTLAHGLVVWPAGALVLARDRRWRELVAWGAIALLATLLFFDGYQVNPGHHIGGGGAAHVETVFIYWCKLLGAPLAFGHATLAVCLGVVVLVVALLRTLDGEWRRERGLLPVLWFVIGAALVIAIGRAEVSHGRIFSRYMIVGGIGWSLIVFHYIDRWSSVRRPFLALACALPLLMLFNHGQNVHHRSDAATFIEHRDRAALRFSQYGEDGRAPVTLHPLPKHATAVLAEAERRGVYRLPPLCELRHFPEAKPSDRINYYVDELTLDDRAAYLAGWVTVPAEVIRRGELHVVLRSAGETRVFTTVQVRRPDVVRAFDNPGWEMSGFRFAIQRARLAPADYRVGFLVAGKRTAEFIMTEHQLRLGRAETLTTTD
jgi:hypothetical protein